MFTTFTLLFAVGVGSRLALARLIRKRFNRHVEVPQPLAVLLLVMAFLPDLILPLAFPVPLGLVLGAVLPDLLLRRA